MPDSLVSEVVENPKNLVVTFRATDTESGETKTEEYELNLANSYIETAYRNIFNNQNMAVSDADLESVEVRSGTVTVSYESQYQIGSQEFKNELGNVAGGYSESVERTRIPYNLELSVRDSNDEVYEKSVSNNNAQRHLDGEISEPQLSREIIFNEILTD
jgi:hypothetical protein